MDTQCVRQLTEYRKRPGSPFSHELTRAILRFEDAEQAG
jgi:hypothetical protein